MLVTLAGCYPDGADYVEELDLVLTDYNKDFDFASKGTFAMPDSVIKITEDNFEDPDGDGKPQFVISEASIPVTSPKDELSLAVEAFDAGVGLGHDRRRHHDLCAGDSRLCRRQGLRHRLLGPAGYDDAGQSLGRIGPVQYRAGAVLDLHA